MRALQAFGEIVSIDPIPPINCRYQPIRIHSGGGDSPARKISADLKKSMVCVYDDTAAIGKLYRRQDEVGTPYCITVDVQSLADQQATVRERDTMQQERIGVDKLKEYLLNKLNN